MHTLFRRLGRAFINPRHALRRCREEIQQAISRWVIRRATRRLKQRRHAGFTGPISRVNVADLVGVILSYKITNPERFAIVAETIATLKRALRDTAVSVRVIDASDPTYVSQVKPLFAQLGLPVTYEAAPLRLTAASLQLLRATPQPYSYIQLDDAVTLGLQPEFFQAACALLKKYEGILHVVSIELPVSVQVVASERAVDIVMFRQTNGEHGTEYSFGVGPLTLLWTERIGDYEFGLFENRFYGFYFHNLVVPTQDYANRLEWFMEHISRNSMHAIELAAKDRTVGPYWTHVAVCLSKVCMVDLDFAPTPGAVRPQNDHNRVVMEALRTGYEPRLRFETADTA